MSNHKFISILFLLSIAFPHLIFGQMMGKSIAPWKDPQVSGINRMQAKATSVSYANIENAIEADRSKSTRMMSLNGNWKFNWSPYQKRLQLIFTRLISMLKNGVPFQFPQIGKCTDMELPFTLISDIHSSLLILPCLPKMIIQLDVI